MVRPRRRGRSGPAYDIVTPSEAEAREDRVARQARRYFSVMLPCLALVVIGFFAPLPGWLRGVVLVVAACLPPIAAIVGSAGPFRRG